MIIVTRIGAGLLMGCGSQDNLGRGGDGVQTVLPRSQGESEEGDNNCLQTDYSALQCR